MYAVEVKNLVKRFGDFTAVNDVSFQIEPGEIFALLGPNGSGKTTTIKSIVGLNLPTAGEIRIEGTDLKADPKSAKRQLSFLPQRVTFPDNLTARETLEFYARIRRVSLNRVQEVLDQANFNGFSDRLVGEYSGGMVQRLGLAVASLPDAPVLVMDEPTVNLDTEGITRFFEFISECKSKKRTILFSSHHLAEVGELADRIAIMVKGKLIQIENVRDYRSERNQKLYICATLKSPISKNAFLNIEKVVRRLGAEDPTMENNEFHFSCQKSDQMRILRELERKGFPVQFIVTTETRLEEVYRKIISDATGGKGAK